jgi:hypothetical protein
MLYKSPSANQVLQQQLIPFYSDIKLSVLPKTVETYHRAMTIINTTTWGDCGKGIARVAQDLQDLAAQLAGLYGCDTDQVGRGCHFTGMHSV